MKKLMLIAMAIMLVVTLTACSQQAPTDDGTGDTQPDDTQEADDNTSDVEESVEGELISENDSVEVGEMV